MAAVVQLQVKPVSRALPIGQRRGQVIDITPRISKEDREALQTALDSFVTGSAYLRDQMYVTIKRFMKYRGLQRVVLDQAIIRYTVQGGLRIEARTSIDSPYCPGCQFYIYDTPINYSERRVKILQCDEKSGWYSYACKCGVIFKRLEGCLDE